MNTRKVHYFGEGDVYRENNLSYEVTQERFPQAVKRLLANWRSRKIKYAKCDPAELAFWIVVSPVVEWASVPTLEEYKQSIKRRSLWTLHAYHSIAKLRISSSTSEIKDDEKTDHSIVAHLEAIAERHWNQTQSRQDSHSHGSQNQTEQLELITKTARAEQQCRNLLGDFTGQESSTLLNELIDRLKSDASISLEDVQKTLSTAKESGMNRIRNFDQRDTAVLNSAVASMAFARMKS